MHLTEHLHRIEQVGNPVIVPPRGISYMLGLQKIHLASSEVLWCLRTRSTNVITFDYD